MWWYRLPALALALMLVAACGFRPLYGGGAEAGAVQALATIEIDRIPRRIGQILRNDLLDHLNPNGPPAHPAYRLKVNVVKTTSPLDIRTDATITRFNVSLEADFVLIDLESGETVYSATTRTVGSYDVIRSDFATLVAEDDTTRRVTREISVEIKTLLAVFFARYRRSPG